jgi:hypothetical protein
VLHDGTSLGRVVIEPLAPYASATVTFAVEPLDAEQGTFEVVFYAEGNEMERNTFTR